MTLPRRSDSNLVCVGCGRRLEVGDQYIEDTASGFVGKEANPEVDDLVADLFGGSSAGGKVVFCEDCTTTGGGDYRFSTYYGEGL